MFKIQLHVNIGGYQVKNTIADSTIQKICLNDFHERKELHYFDKFSHIDKCWEDGILTKIAIFDRYGFQIQQKNWHLGKLKSIYNFKSSIRHGRCREWNGKTLVSDFFYIDGQLHGAQKLWHPNGKKMQITYYKMGKIIYYIAWDEKGMRHFFYSSLPEN